MSFEELCSHLVKEPWNCTMDQIANMNIRQIHNIYLRPKKEDGADLETVGDFKPLKEGMSLRKMFIKRARIFGKTDVEIKEKWNELHAAEYGELEEADFQEKLE